MSDSSVLTAESREKVGTRPSRALRSEGRIPANLQADADNAHVDFSIFHKTRAPAQNIYQTRSAVLSRVDTTQLDEQTIE